MKLHVETDIFLELTAQHHAQGLLNAVNENREHLGKFLPWVSQMQSLENFTEYINNCRQLYSEGNEMSFVILQGGAVVGRIGIHHIQPQNDNGEIGYWLIKSATGKGIISKSCRLLVSIGFDQLNLHRIVIKAATGNAESRNIAERLGFTYEGILREAEKVNGIFFDLAVYSLLKHEWKNQNTNQHSA